VRLALVRVTSENLRVVNLSGLPQYQPWWHGGHPCETCSGVKEVDVTACSNETVLRAVATRARVALGLDLFALLRSLGEEGMRYSLSNHDSLLLASPAMLMQGGALVTSGLMSE
jgi:hypothetical protein